MFKIISAKNARKNTAQYIFQSFHNNDRKCQKIFSKIITVIITMFRKYTGKNIRRKAKKERILEDLKKKKRRLGDMLERMLEDMLEKMHEEMLENIFKKTLENKLERI